MTDRDPATEPRRGERVLALVDASRPSLAALRAAARLAARRQVELTALFVEDIALVRSASHAFSREVGAVSGHVRQLDTLTMETRLRRLGDRARRALAEIADAHGIAHSLSIRRGRVVDEIHAVAVPGDLLVLARAGWSAPPGRWFGSTARALVQSARVPLLLHDEHVPRPDGRVVAFIDDAEAAREIVAFAAILARHEGRALSVLLAPHADLAEACRLAVANESEQIRNELRTQELPATDSQTIARALEAEGAAELVVSRRSRPLREASVDDLLTQLDLPVIILP